MHPRISLVARISFIAVLIVLIRLVFFSRDDWPDDLSPDAWRSAEQVRKALVVASLAGDDTSWMNEHLPEWEKFIYIVNDASAALTVPRNKGRESMAYLTFIIDHYDNLPHYMIFLHALRYQWHNEDPMYDGLPMIRNLRLEHVLEVGFTNMRCTWVLGCPNEVKPALQPTHANDDDYSVIQVEAAYADAFRHFFPSKPVPTAVGTHCGAQFALSRDKVLDRPKGDYIKYRQWLLDTPLDDSVSGRILEYTWHIIMGKPAVHCPHTGSCFCEKYGLCNLTCTEEQCQNRYILPQYSIIPNGWPKYGPGRDGWPAVDWWKGNG